MPKGESSRKTRQENSKGAEIVAGVAVSGNLHQAKSPTPFGLGLFSMGFSA
jgi:hypothetical protein